MKKIKNFIDSLDLHKVTKATWIRTIIFAAMVINLILGAFGLPSLDLGTESIEQVAVLVITIFTFLEAFWKNNSFTNSAIEADKKYKELEEEKKNGN